MKLFTEWMQVRSANQAMTDWVYVSTAKIEEARKTLEAKGPEMFRDFTIQETREDQKQTLITFKGSPSVTLFELEEMGIFPDVF